MPLVGIGTLPTPFSPASVPLPPETGGRGHTSLRVGGWESPNSDEGHTLWYSLYVRTLWPPVAICRRCRWHRWQICHRCRWYQWCTLACEYLREFSKNFKTVLMWYSGAGGKLIHEKNRKQKISWHCPLKVGNGRDVCKNMDDNDSRDVRSSRELTQGKTRQQDHRIACIGAATGTSGASQTVSTSGIQFQGCHIEYALSVARMQAAYEFSWK